MIIHQLYNSQGNYHYNAYIYTDTSWFAHFHACYELVYAKRNFAVITVNGTQHILEEGELYLIPPYTVHSLEISKESDTWVGVFSEDFISDFSTKYKYTEFSKFRCDSKILEILDTYFFFEGTPEHYLLTASLYLVCGECLKNAECGHRENRDEFMSKVIDYISANLSQDISLRDIAENLKYEYHYFSALFNRCFSSNFKNFINRLRFENACRLLCDSSLDITEICGRCGFGSIRNFNRVFRQFSGVTPTEYRTKTL